ncbi:hypothetical protein RKE29_30020, partial [Streptomyces sp. B1866]|nr:hypothetical protein [Streptomyces sp. B1866]
MTVVRLDLRRDRSGPGGPEAAVRRAADEPDAGGGRRFLVIDHAADLIGHQGLYERLFAHAMVPTLCLAVGVPGPRPGTAGPGPDGLDAPGPGTAGPAADYPATDYSGVGDPAADYPAAGEWAADDLAGTGPAGGGLAGAGRAGR